jgi:hypothetical protein
MGSGGVVFESTFPGEPPRRNTLIESNRLIVPEGKPNQTAVVEVMLSAPVTPGIHQSYWRMRNPKGIFFGPIIGVTLEVVRECEFNAYGAPVINKFEILGVGNVFQPTDPVMVDAEFGENITLDWNIINADNFDIVIEDPTGDVETVSTSDQRGRVTFPVSELGEYIVTLYADNGPCTVPAEVRINVFPPEDEQFRLIIIRAGRASRISGADNNLRFSSSVQSGDVKAEWEHFDKDTDDFNLFAELYQRKDTETCPKLFGYRLPCYTTRGDWTLIRSISPLDVGGEGDAQGAVIVEKAESLCPSSYDPTEEEYKVRYYMLASKDGRRADPWRSNVVDVPCEPTDLKPLPAEIP